MRFLAALIFLCSSISTFAAGKYDFLRTLEKSIPFKSEISRYSNRERVAPLEQDMRPYYNDFQQQKMVKIFIGYGVEVYGSKRLSSFRKMLFELAKKEGLDLSDWQENVDFSHIAFTDSSTGIQYEIDQGYERNQYIASFSSYDIVMYHGHSRYGRGPAFGHFDQYFRMGHLFKSLEVDTLNPYFNDEPILLQEKFPVLKTSIEGKIYPYQYQGAKDSDSYLPDNTFTKNIEGMAKDLNKTIFKTGRQLIYLYSCENWHYFQEPLRARFPNPAEKMIFGTQKTGYWGSEPEAVFVASIIKQLPLATQINHELNETKDCNECFVTY